MTPTPDAPDNAGVACPAPRRPLRAGVALAALSLAARVGAQAPVHHGVLTVRPAAGRIDRTTGESSLVVRRWTFTPAPDTNGVDPAREAVLVAIGDADRFVVPAGALRASRNGRVFTYGHATTRGVRRLRLVRAGDGSWTVRFAVAGVDLSRLTLAFPACQALAVVIGDDDGFSGVALDRPGGTASRRLRLTGACDDVADWPWL